MIADVAQTKSTWFKGYNEEFFVNRGNTTRYIMGYVPALVYAAEKDQTDTPSKETLV